MSGLPVPELPSPTGRRVRRRGVGPSSVSVVVCSRDRPDRLRRALRSVLGQDPAPAEVIVVGHGLQALPVDVGGNRRVRALDIAACPTGRARAAGLAAVTTPFVAYCDDLD